MIWAVLGVLYLGTPLVCWGMRARTGLVGAVVGGALLACAAAVLALHLEWITDRARAEAYVAHPFAAALLIGAGSLWERRLLGPRKTLPYDRSTAAAATLGGYLAACGLASVAYVVVFLSVADVPSSTDVLPLPAGLAVRSDETDSCGTCSSDLVTRLIVIGSDTGLPPDEVFKRLKAALIADHGWQLGTTGTAERRSGWLLDQRRVSITVSSTAEGAQVLLEGGGL